MGIVSRKPGIAYKLKYWLMFAKVLLNLNKGKLISVGYEDRGCGKTTILSKVSRLFNIPIIVPNKVQENAYRRRGCHAYSISSVGTGMKFPKGVLIEEGLLSSQINALKELGIKVRTGFIYDKFS